MRVYDIRIIVKKVQVDDSTTDTRLGLNRPRDREIEIKGNLKIPSFSFPLFSISFPINPDQTSPTMTSIGRKPVGEVIVDVRPLVTGYGAEMLTSTITHLCSLL
jgi:hypothetical protein